MAIANTTVRASTAASTTANQMSDFGMDTELKPRSSARRSWVRFPPRVITLFCLFQGISIYYILHRQRQPASRVDAKSPKTKLGKILTAKSSMPNPGIEPRTWCTRQKHDRGFSSVSIPKCDPAAGPLDGSTILLPAAERAGQGVMHLSFFSFFSTSS